MEQLLFYLFLAIILSFICSILEAVILSVSHSFITIKIEEGKSYAKSLHSFKEHINKPLAAILSLNTFANTMGAAGVGAQAQILWGEEYLSIASIGITLSILIFSEIIPKTIGATFNQQLAPVTTYVLKFLVFVLAPVVYLMGIITEMFKKMNTKGTISRQELSVMADISEKEGVLKKDESLIIRNLLRFSEIKARDIMTPRTVVVASVEGQSIRDFFDAGSTKHFSRIPIFKDNIDNITGYVLKDDLLVKIIEDKADEPMNICLRDVKKVEESTPLPELYDMMTKQNEHFAIVDDQYGGFAGLVTMEDVIETLLGIEITDESDRIEDLQKFARKNWEYRAKKLGLFSSDDEHDEE